MSVSTRPEVPLPDGADPAVADEWQPPYDGDPAYRVVWSPPRMAAGVDVRSAAMQVEDGALVTQGVDAPSVFIGDDRYWPDDARALADAIHAAASQADAWAGRQAGNPDQPTALSLLLRAHDHLIEGHAAVAAAVADLDGPRATRTAQVAEQLHAACDALGAIIDALDGVDAPEA